MRARGTRWFGLHTAACAVLAVGIAAGCAPDERSAREVGGPAAAPSAPPSPPARFGFGSPADAERIARHDIDVGPDGAGLPAGRGDVAEGARVYRVACAECHGPTGSDGPYDVLVGGEPWGDGDPPRPRTIGNYWPYATTLYDYISRAMPQHAPGSLTADETYAVIAWLLAQNGVVGEDFVADAATLPAVVMPARDRFVPDDREGGARIR